MKVTKLEPVAKTKYKVYLDEQFAFVLYKGELSRYRIREEGELSQQTAEQIKTEVLLKRAKLRAMHLLNQMDRTKEQLRQKLKRDFYPDEIVEAALQYVEAFGYIGDADYARRYISGRQDSKSILEIKMALLQKGVSKRIVEQALDECYKEQEEATTIRRILEKKHFCPDTATDVEKKRMQDYLLRKGFRYEDVRQVIQVSFWNT